MLPTNFEDSVEHMRYFYDVLAAAMMDGNIYYDFYSPRRPVVSAGSLPVHVVLSKNPIDMANYLR
jgi:hypothetical protein